VNFVTTIYEPFDALQIAFAFWRLLKTALAKFSLVSYFTYGHVCIRFFFRNFLWLIFFEVAAKTNSDWLGFRYHRLLVF